MTSFHTRNAVSVSIGGTEVQQITYRDEPVVTFAMVDEIHQRPEGTAGRTFRDNRERFIDGDDFIVGNLDVLRRAFPGAFPARGGGEIMLVTRRGYLKLVKPMSDDRAWQVQGEMIDRYFAVEKTQRIVSSPAHMATVTREARLQHRMFMSICKECGIKGNQAVLSSNKATKATTGVDMMGLLGITHIDAKVNEPDIRPTDIAERVGLKNAQDVNKTLAHLGYQTPLRDSKGNLYYELTPKGERAGGVFKDTNRRTNHGAPVKQLMWASRIVDLLRAEMAEAQ